VGPGSAEPQLARDRRRRAAVLLAVSLLALCLGELVGHTGVGGRLELPTLDARYDLRGRTTPWPGIAIVGIDSQSITAIGRYPFDRHVDAEMIDRLRKDGARVIAYDEVFDAGTYAAADSALLEAAGRVHGRLVLAATATNSLGQTFVLGGVLHQQQVGAAVGTALFPEDADGRVRHVPYAVERLKSFAVETALTAGLPAASIGRIFGRGPLLIDYPGPAGTVPTYSFDDVLDGRVPAGALRGRIVVVGSTAADLQDVHSVPLSTSQPMSGPELEADAIATLMQGGPLRGAAGGLDDLALLLCALGPALLGWRTKGRWVIIGAGLMLAVLFAGAQVAFDDGRVISLAPAIVALLASAAGALRGMIWLERQETQALRHALRERFARFDEEIVDAVLANRGAVGARARAIGPESVIAGYRLQTPAGRGGMGVVYLATRVRLDRSVAVKLIHPDRADDPDFRARFAHESRLAAGLDHPHVIPVYEAGDDHGLLFIAMRHVSGRNLHELIATSAPLPPALACALLAQIARALHCAHKAGLIHRDVKPANVLVDEGEVGDIPHCYLTDFGVSQDLRAVERAATGGVVGTLDYIAPEQRLGQPVGPAADIYSLGRILYQALCGRLPESGGTAASAVWPAVPPALDVILARALAQDPAERYGTALEFARLLSALAVSDSGDRPPTPVPAAETTTVSSAAVTMPPS
jgi:CHASE2 domain-containing sensor protein